MEKIREKYNKTALPEVKKEFGLKNNLEVPRITKVVVNTGIGKYIKDGAAIEEIQKALTEITGQKAIMVKTRKSIAGFKTRVGLEVGVKVTLRGPHMWSFLEKLVSVALPRVRDFRGIKISSVDNNGNLNIGIKEHTIFPEIVPEQVRNVFSLQVNVSTTAKDKQLGMALFRNLGFPIENK
ncbi:MAG TPA: 50S ribosomal protein L5 [Patescibacteria group bacterium]|nr:50S ribosomal protein L5 [Patescibacteria group bacterium]